MLNTKIIIIYITPINILEIGSNPIVINIAKVTLNIYIGIDVAV